MAENLHIGMMVIANEKIEVQHRIQPQYYPACGVTGEVKYVSYDGSLVQIQWEPCTTDGNGCWLCDSQFVDVLEETELEINTQDLFHAVFE